MKITPQIYVTSDTHFGHKNMIKWGHREEGFDQKLVDVWNSIVFKKAIVLHLGDLTMCNKETTLKYTSQLNGQKFLILGNHDKNSVTWYKDIGFTVIPNAYYQHKGSHYLFTHEPVESLPADWFNIHGHLHGNGNRLDETRWIAESKQHIDVGVDPMQYKPVQLLQLMNDFGRMKRARNKN